MVVSVGRRRFLVGALAGLATVGTGCTDTTGSNSTTNQGSRSRTEIDPQRTTASTATRGAESTACEEALQRLPSMVDEVEYGSLNGFSLTTNRTALSIGDSVVFRLRNETGTEAMTGNRHKFDVQRRLDGEWRSIYWSDGASYTDMGYGQQPGEGFTWRFTLTRQGLKHTSGTNPPYSVCEPLVSGEYRFVYWGVSREGEDENDSGVGVRFGLTTPDSTEAPGR